MINRFAVYLSLVLLVCPQSVWSELPGGVAYREFKNQQGNSMRARMLSYHKGKGEVKLRAAGGRDYTFQVDSLSAEDQQYISNWNPRERIVRLLDEYDFDSLLSAYGMKSSKLKLKKDGKYYVPAKVNQTFADFFIDTGSFLSIVDRVVADAANAEFTGRTFADFTLANGTLEPVRSAKFKTFSLGDITSRDWEMGCCNLAVTGRPYEGVLGGDFLLLRYGLLDWGRENIYFSNTEKKPVFKSNIPLTFLREYTCRSKGKFIGELDSVNEGSATFSVDGGQKATYPISDLSSTDREYIDLWTTHPLRKKMSLTVAEVLKAKGFHSVSYQYGNSVIPAFELRIGTKPVRFLINPSMSFSYFDEGAADGLGIPVFGTRDRLRTAAGEVILLNGVRISGLRVGQKSLGELYFRALDLEDAGVNGAVPISTCMAFRFPELKERLTKKAEIQGILGRDILQQIGAIIDYESQQMFLRP